MRKSLLPMLLLTLYVSGCASLDQNKSPAPLSPPSCPAPPKLPALPPAPSSLERSFLMDLEMSLFRLRSEQKKSEPTLKPADGSTKPLGLK